MQPTRGFNSGLSPDVSGIQGKMQKNLWMWNPSAVNAEPIRIHSNTKDISEEPGNRHLILEFAQCLSLKNFLELPLLSKHPFTKGLLSSRHCVRCFGIKSEGVTLLSKSYRMSSTRWRAGLAEWGTFIPILPVENLRPQRVNNLKIHPESYGLCTHLT